MIWRGQHRRVNGFSALQASILVHVNLLCFRMEILL